MKPRPWLIPAAIGIALFLLNVALNLPLFLPGDSPYRDSIEGGYRGMTRFIAEHPNPWGWNPLQYCGLPLQFTYLPALHYTNAAVSWMTTLSPGYTYKLVTATAACLAPVAVFLFVLFFTKSRTWAAAAAVAYTFFSPLYGLIPQVDKDRGIIYLPWRLHVFAKYGEGPHIAALTLIPLTIVAAWGSSTVHRYWQIPLTALLMAAIALTNWVAALALAICLIVLCLAAIAAPDVKIRWWRIAGAALLAYGFAAFWLTPTFIQTVAFNWPVDAFNYKLQAAQNWLLAGWGAGVVVLRLAMYGLRWPFYGTFVSLATFTFGYPVLIFYSYGIDVLPESRRYAPEFELFLILTIFVFFRFNLETTNRVRQVCAVALAVPLLYAGVPLAKRYLTQGYARWKPLPPEQTTEYRVAQWIRDQHPRGRVLASGGLRFRLNSWFDLHQVGGAFESGLRNRAPVHMAYQIRTSIGSTPESDASDSIEQMQALGVEYVVIHGPRSAEHYRDYKNPLKFEGVLERVYSGADDYVYRVPFRSLAHLIQPHEQPRYAVNRWFPAYIEAIRDTSRPALDVQWHGPAKLTVRGPVLAGHDIVVAVTNEEGWRATQDGQPVPLEKNKFNYVVVKARPSANSTVLLEFGSTVEQRAMAVVSFFVWLGTARWLWRRRRTTPAPVYHEDQWQKPPASMASA